MEPELWNLAKTITTITACMTYTRFAASRLNPGFLRLAAFLPVLGLLPILPFSFSTIHLRASFAFFLVWLGMFKLLLLAFARGPLHPSLPLLPFICTASLPVKLPAKSGADAKAPQTSHFLAKLFLSSAIKAAVLAVLVAQYEHKDGMNHYLLLCLYCLHLYLAIEIILASTAAIANGLLGMELEPQFNKPYFAASLRDFWGRRWNLMVSSILRPSVYEPVRAHFGTAAGTIATFLVSGFMHEVLLYYMTFGGRPTGEMTAFFLLHGVCTAAEGWWTRDKGRWRPPRVVATPLTLVFVVVTGFWLLFPPIVRPGTDEKVIAESRAVMAFFVEAGRKLAGLTGLAF